MPGWCVATYLYCHSLVGALGSTGGFGVPFYTKTVVSGGDSWERRNQPRAGPTLDREALSCGAGGGIAAQPEGSAPCPGRGERVRP